MKKEFDGIDFDKMQIKSGSRVRVIVDGEINSVSKRSTSKRILLGKNYAWKYATQRTFEQEKDIYEQIQHLDQIVLESSFIKKNSHYLIKQQKTNSILGFNDYINTKKNTWKLFNPPYTKEILVDLANILVLLNRAKIEVIDLDHSFTLSDIGYHSGHWKLFDFDFMHRPPRQPLTIEELVEWFIPPYSTVEKGCDKNIDPTYFDKLKDKDIAKLSKAFYEELCKN